MITQKYCPGLISTAVYAQTSCNPPIIFASRTISYIGPDMFTYINVVEVEKVIDRTIEKTPTYPSWFPEFQFSDGSPLEYEQDFCLAVCQGTGENRQLDVFKHINFGGSWDSRYKFEGFNMSRNTTREKDCKTLCPKNQIRYTKRFDSNLLRLYDLYDKKTKSILELVAEIGGYSGLLAGASVITFLEFGEHILNQVTNVVVEVLSKISRQNIVETMPRRSP